MHDGPVAASSTKLQALPTKPVGKPVVNQAWKYLASAHVSVGAILESLDAYRAANMKAAKKDPRGRTSNKEMELLRAALVFASSGLDASLQRLVYDLLPHLIRGGATGAVHQYELYRKQQLADPTADFIAAVVSLDPSASLLEEYVKYKTKASYQGSGDLRVRVRNTLGIAKSAIPDSDLTALDPFFTARNAIVHGMDFTNTTAASSRARNSRARDATVVECDGAFSVAARFILEGAKLA